MSNSRHGLYRLAAFTQEPNGGNPAGVWLGDDFPDAARMLEIAGDVGYSETAFAIPDDTGYLVRYFSPVKEVTFCGHATIALGVLLGDEIGPGRYPLTTAAGVVSVATRSTEHGVMEATLTSVAPSTELAPEDAVARALSALHWTRHDLDDEWEPAIAYAGARHLTLQVASRVTLRDVDYEFEDMRKLMSDLDLTTVNLFWPESESVYHSRNLFAVGGVVEDPATGAAAAALGGHLRIRGLVEIPITLTVHQGYDMGRPSLLHVKIPSDGGIEVAGKAVPIPDL